MGNGFTKLTHCFSPSRPRPRPCRRIDSAAVTSEPLDEGLGHSFCYVTTTITPTTTPTFYSISGAAVSANTSTALSTSLPYDSLPSSAFDSSTSFSSYPLYPVPRFSGPIDRGFLSGPLDPRSSSSALFSGPLHLNKHINSSQLRRSFSHGGRLIRNLSKAIGRTVSVPVKVLSKQDSLNYNSPGSSSSSVEISDEVDDSNNNCQWAQGKAGEDRVHVVVSEEHGWLFVGIYDGFNGPDATDYLLSNLYSAIRRELEGLLWVEKGEGERCGEEGGEKRVRWKCDWEGEGLEKPNHSEVLKAMNEGLRRTEEGFLGIADEVFVENPELALMGSCVLVAMMKGEDLYVMNIGDSRAVLGHKDLERVREGSLNDFGLDFSPTLSALQLTLDHSTCVEEEVRRIRSEHPDDECAVMNDRVKGSLKVTRAFGAGFLKQPKWNDALLEVFRIDYVGSSPYITCNPFLHHHRLGPRDKFLILSSDGLYQYFTNEEVVAQVELFIALTPEGDPAQHLVEEVIFRAAKKAGLDFHELLEIPQGDRRRYHDDVSIIVISFEGRIWRSCV